MPDLDKSDKKTIPLNWGLYSFSLIFLFSIILILRWGNLPTFIDIYYHLSTMLGFNNAGGFVTKAFWEYGPVGRSHLYPPLFHFIMLVFYKLGLAPIKIGKLMELVMYPLLLASVWQVIRNVFYPRLAFFCVLVATSAYPFYLSIVDFLPSSLAVIFGLMTFLCIEKRKLMAASILLAFSFYTHSSTAGYLILAFLLYGLLNIQRLKTILVICFSSIILALPLLIHQLSSRRYVDFKRVVENFPFEIDIFVYLLALIGLIFSFRRDKKYLFFLSLVLPTVVFLNYRYRFLCGQGSRGFIFLAALSLDLFYEKLSEKLSQQIISRGFFYSIFFLTVIFFIFTAPTISLYKGKAKFNFLNSTYLNLIPQVFSPLRANELSIYYPRLFEEAVGIIQENTTPSDIIYCNEPYIGGLLSVLTGRATSGAMLEEIRPFKRFDPISVAKIVAWFRNPDIDYKNQIEVIKKKYNLIQLAQTQAVLIYKNPDAEARISPIKALLPNAAVYSILTIMVGLIVLDLVRPAKGGLMKEVKRRHKLWSLQEKERRDNLCV